MRYKPASHTRAHFTRQLLLELFSYDPHSGAFCWNDSGDEVLKVNNCGYRWAWVDGHALLVHRAAWRMQTGDWPAQMVDHIDRCKTNNAWTNLRLAGHSLNSQNVFDPTRTNKSGFRGVSIDERVRSKPFKAAIVIDGVRRHLGCFASPVDAHAAYLKAKRVFHPEAFSEASQ